METKQTAVEWLIKELGEYFPHDIGGINYMVEKAKQLEKEQHGDTWNKALDAYEDRGYLYVRAWTDFDDHYRETYGK